MRPTCGSTRHLTEGQLCSTLLPSHRYPNPFVGSGYPPPLPPPPTSSAAAVAGRVFSKLRPSSRPLSVRLCLCPDRCLCLLFSRWGLGSWTPVTMPPTTSTTTTLPGPLCATVTGLARGSGGGCCLSTTDPPSERLIRSGCSRASRLPGSHNPTPGSTS